MTKSEIFKAAHALAKATVEVVGDYMIAFSLALKETYKMTEKTLEKKLIDLGLSVWGEDFGKPRIYINPESMGAIFGLELSFYKTGSISAAKLNGEKISNSKAYKLLQNKIYFDINSKAFVGTKLETII